MAPAAQTYTWPRVQHAVAYWVSQVTGFPADQPDPNVDPAPRVVWSTFDLATVPKPFVSLQRLAMQTAGFPARLVSEQAVSQRITVTETTPGERVAVWLAWSEVSVLVEAGDTVTDVRDRLLAALVAGVANTQEPLGFAADGADGVTVTPRGTWVVDVLALVGCTVADVDTEVVSSSAVTRIYRVRVQLYGFAGVGDESIDEYGEALLHSLHDPGESGGLRFLAQYGVGVEGLPEAIADISAISGPLLERRAFFDVSFVAKSVQYRREPTTIEAFDPPAVQGIFG